MTHVKFNRLPLLFEDILNEFPAKWGKDWHGLNFPPVNIHETGEGLHLELNAPGRNKEDFKINVEESVLTISYEKKQEETEKDYKTVRREFSFESFKRSFNLGENINVENIQAKYDNGVLKVFLPKKEVVKEAAKQISVQ
jgi:HSP20 family protein